MSQVIPFETGLKIGVGFNSSTHDIHQAAIKFESPPSIDSGAGGQTIHQQVDYARSTSDLAKFLSVSAAASIKTISGGGSAKAKFVNQIKINKFSINLYVHITVENAQETLNLADVRLTDSGRAAYPDQKIFTEQFGDSFIFGQVTGGEYLAIIEVIAESEEQRRKITATINGSGSTGVVSGSFSAKMKNTLQQLKSEFSINVKRMRVGGQGNLDSFSLDEVDPEIFLAEADKFPDAVLSYPVPTSVITIPYAHIKHPTVTTPFERLQQSFALEKLEQYRQGFNDCITQLDYALSHPSQFPEIDLVATQRRREEVAEMIEKVVRRERVCVSDSEKCSVASISTELLNPNLPERSSSRGNSMTTIQVGTVNGDRSDPAWKLDVGSGERLYRKQVKFESNFILIPRVTTALWHIDAGNTPQGLLFAVFAENISTEGFDIVFKTWGETVVPAASASWLATGT